MNREEQGRWGGLRGSPGGSGGRGVEGVGGGWRPVAKNFAATATGLACPPRPGLEREIIGKEDEVAEREKRRGPLGGARELSACLSCLSVCLSVRMDATTEELLLFTFNYNLEGKKAAATALQWHRRTQQPMLSPLARGGK